MRLILFSHFLFISLSIFAETSANPTPDYFARYKYDLSEATTLLKSAEGKDLSASPEAVKFLDDMGYWGVVRKGGTFQFTPDLQKQLAAQFSYLEKANRYDEGDHVWLKAQNADEKPYGVGNVNHRAQILKKYQSNGTDYYIVNLYVDGKEKMDQIDGEFYDGRKGKILYYGQNYELKPKTIVVTKTELDRMNSPSVSLPVDNQGEKLDWANDKVWIDKLDGFKSKIASGLTDTNPWIIDWTASPDKIETQQLEHLRQIFRHFKMNRNAPSNNGKGIGLRSCGGGVCFDQALVLTFAIQAVGQTLGLKAINLDGTTVNPMGGHGFVRVDIKGHKQPIYFERVADYQQWKDFAKNPAAYKADYLQADDFFKAMEEGKFPSRYPGVRVEANNLIVISDPGWADYGKTPDQFARVKQEVALNVIPIDSNRAVNNRSSGREMTEVAREVVAKGPLMTYSPQVVKDLTGDREQLAKEIEEQIKKGAADPVSEAQKSINSNTKAVTACGSTLSSI